jgi:hypothetical protein
MSASEFRSQGFVICQGWKREVQALAEAGYYKESPILKRGLCAAGLDWLQLFLATSADETKDGREDHAFAERMLRAAIRKLAKLANPFRSKKGRGTHGN